MPTYRNETGRRVTHCDMNYMEWRPGEEKSLPFFVPHEKLGLTVVSDEPLVEKHVHDWTAELTPNDPLTVKLPYHEAFELSIHAASGSADVYIGDSAEPVTVNEMESHFSSAAYTYAKCPRLRLVSEEGAEIRIKVEERRPVKGGR